MKLKNKYFFLRHGQTIYQKEQRGVNYGAEENPFIDLTDEGRQMIRDSAENLANICKGKNIKIDLVFASPYLRTKQSAEIASQIIGADKINYDNRLVDINLGEFMGRPLEESTKFYFSGSNIFDNKPEGGESWNDILNRTKIFLDELEEKYENKNILIVSHADPIWIMAGYLKGFKKPEEFMATRRTKNNLQPHLGELIEI